MKKLRIAVVGCGLDGGGAAALLLRLGFDVSIYEQAERFHQIGAGIHLTPNILMALDGLEIESAPVKHGYRSGAYVSRDAATAERLFRLPLHDAEATYGGKYLTIPRYEFHQVLVSALRGHQIHYGMKPDSIEQNPDGLTLHFAGGVSAACDLLVGAGGLSSVVRRTIRGDAAPAFSGHVAYRSVCASAEAARGRLREVVGGGRQVRGGLLNDATARAPLLCRRLQDSELAPNTPSLPGSREELLSQFASFHPYIRDIPSASQDFSKWPLSCWVTPAIQ